MEALEIKKEAYLNMLKLMPMGVLAEFAQSLYDTINWDGRTSHDQGIILDLAMDLLKKYFPEFELKTTLNIRFTIVKNMVFGHQIK